ncbi:MAG TPA: lactonase family protein [Candidatus Fimimorpha faecalis]|uniref:Lactonase family protein n=1 Tax=Candidatus Fimimorpha faecalis TaxID=2840824 RepID=A0A9D1EF29_9FIRM|nr:lactonase family protein [Candidatus Fimimorpha faecalis]
MGTKYAAYVGCYTFHGSSKGICIFDVDVKKGRLKKRKEVAVNNSSYLTISHNKKFLYTVVDEGVAAFRILPDGDLDHINTATIKGMRGCFLTVDSKNKFLLTAGYHDGKMTVLKLRNDGSVGKVTDEFYDNGIGSVAERTFRPHVSCVAFTPDEKYVCMVDSGIDQVRIFRFDHQRGFVRLVDILHCELNSAPRHLRFSKDGRHMYLISELKNYITVYNYIPGDSHPEFEFKQLVSSVPKKHTEISAACALRFSPDDNYVFSSNAGENTVGFFERNMENGLLYNKCILPISGEYPKDIAVFPDGKHIVCMNQDSNSLTFFTLNYEENVIVMNGLPLKLDNPNCCEFVELEE